MTILKLLAGLESEGITVPRADDYRRLSSALNATPEPQIPGPLLDTDPETLAAHGAAWAAWKANRDDHAREANRLAQRLDAEMAGILAGEAEAIVDVLAPAFAAAADLARAVVAAGASPSDTLETLALRAPDAIPTWLAFQGAPVRRLIHLARLRTDLAAITDEHGARSMPNLSLLVTRPARPVLLASDPDRSLWWPWLTVAEHLVMLRPSEVDVDDVLTAKGYNPRAIAREAQRREAATTPARTAPTTHAAPAPVPLPA